MKVIDFHTHIVPSEYPGRPVGVDEPNWPVMQRIDDRRSQMMINGTPYRTFESFYWSTEERIRRLDEEGIAMQVISPLPELLSYWLAADAAEVLTDFMNSTIADMVRSAPDRFIGLGAVAMQDTARAVRQLERAKTQHGLVGIHVGSNINGQSVADPAFYPVLEAAEALDMLVFVHGIRPDSADRMLGPRLMPAVVGVPHENALAISSFIMSDILARFPKLKLAFAHGGGTIAAVIDRMNSVWSAFDVMRADLTVSPADYVRRFYYDTVVFGPDYLAYLVKVLGASQLLAGTDGPVDFGQPRMDELLAAARISEADQALISHKNAERLFGL